MAKNDGKDKPTLHLQKSGQGAWDVENLLDIELQCELPHLSLLTLKFRKYFYSNGVS